MADWQQTRLGEISQIYSGFAFRSQDLGEHGIPVVKIGNIQNKRVIPECADHLPDELFLEKMNRYFLKQDDTLIAMTGAGSVGKVGKMPRVDSRFLVNQRVAIVRPDNSLCEPAFVYFALSQDFYETKLYGLGLGAGQPNVSAKQIGDLEIPFPPLPVQRRIAGILSAYDELMENSQRRIRLLEAMARALYREWFVHFRFPGHEKLPRVASPLGEIPAGWKVDRLETICERITSGGTPRTSASEYWDGGIPWLSSGETGNTFIIGTEKTITQEGVSNSSTRLARSGCTVIASAGQGKTRGQTSMLRLDCYINQSTIALTADRKQATDNFLFLNLSGRYNQFRQISDGSSRGSLTTKLLANLEVIVPSVDLVHKFDDLVAPIIKSIEISLRKIQNLRRTRDLLLPRLLSGQVELNAQAA